MISHIQYLRALETIDLYHRQKSKNKDFTEGKEMIIENKKTDLSNVKIGDFLIYKRENGKGLKNFVLGKKYPVVDKKQARYFEMELIIKIENESGEGIWIKVKNHYRRWETL